MPVFEYKCSGCGNKFDVYHKSSGNMEEVVCPKCNSKESKKLFSTFAASVGSSSPSEGCSSGSCPLPSYGGCPGGMCGLN